MCPCQVDHALAKPHWAQRRTSSSPLLNSAWNTPEANSQRQSWHSGNFSTARCSATLGQEACGLNIEADTVGGDNADIPLPTDDALGPVQGFPHVMMTPDDVITERREPL